VSAQVGGKLSQLGGRLIDATAKQMSGLFFKRFAEEIEAQCGDGAQVQQNVGSTASSSTATASATQSAQHQQAARRPRPAPAPMDITPGVFKHVKSMGIVLLLAAVTVCWYQFGGVLPSFTPNSGTHVSPDFASGVLLIIVAAVGYLFGRQQSRTIHVDRDVMNQIAGAWLERRE